MQDGSGPQDGQVEVGTQGKGILLLRAWMQDSLRQEPRQVREVEKRRAQSGRTNRGRHICLSRFLQLVVLLLVQLRAHAAAEVVVFPVDLQLHALVVDEVAAVVAPDEQTGL